MHAIFLNKKTGAKANRKRLKIIADQNSFPLQKNLEKTQLKFTLAGNGERIKKSMVAKAVDDI